MADVLRIAVFGTESTGKTSLARRLAEHFGEPWATEYVREFWDARQGQIVAADLETIARGQILREDEAAARARRVVFCDTDLLTCTIWDDLLFPGRCPEWVRREAEQRARRFARYLLCDTDVPFIPDPQRCFPDPVARLRARDVWREALVSRGLPHIDIRGSWEAREQLAIAAVQQLLETASPPAGTQRTQRLEPPDRNHGIS